MERNFNLPEQALALIKFFSKKEHYLAFKNGHTLFRTPHYYRNCEDKGRGDRSESCLGYWDTTLGDKMPSIVLDDSLFDMTNVKSILIYPSHEQRDSWLQSWCLIEPSNCFSESLQKMIDDFGPYFVLLHAKDIEAYANLLKRASNSEVRYGLIHYSANRLDHSLTTKSSDLDYQKEFRFYLGECDKSEMADRNIYVDGLNKLLPDAGSLKLLSPSGKKFYCTLGHNKVISI